jgi:hypothetical protein
MQKWEECETDHGLEVYGKITAGTTASLAVNWLILTVFYDDGRGYSV